MQKYLLLGLILAGSISTQVVTLPEPATTQVQENEEVELQNEIDKKTLTAVLIVSRLLKIVRNYQEKFVNFLIAQAGVWGNYLQKLWQEKIKVFFIDAWQVTSEMVKHSEFRKRVSRKIKAWINVPKVGTQVPENIDREPAEEDDIDQPQHPAA